MKLSAACTNLRGESTDIEMLDLVLTDENQGDPEIKKQAIVRTCGVVIEFIPASRQ